LSRIGILGGTFDPPHNGHLALAEAAISRLDLSKVIFIPARVPPHKPAEDISSEQDRLEMLKLAVDSDNRFEISEIELNRGGPSFTVDTLSRLKTENPAQELFFIIGSDNVSEMESWHQPEQIRELARVAAAVRPGYSMQGKFAEMVEPFDMLPVDISSTAVRAKVRSGESISGLVPEPVEDYIKSKGLYR
jgi:nicotinate-nucleotide adenylyltransferase